MPSLFSKRFELAALCTEAHSSGPSGAASAAAATLVSVGTLASLGLPFHHR